MSHHDTLQATVILDSATSGEATGIVDISLPPAWDGPPLHHHDFDEAFYVLEGELTLQVGEEVTTAAAGSLAFAPRGVHHTVANTADAPARYLLVCTPAGFERHWARIAAEAAGVEPPHWALQPIPEVTVVGPPIAARA